MAEPIVVIGIGGFGRETLDVIGAINVHSTEPIWDVRGVVDDDPSAENLQRLDRRGIEFLGATDVPLNWANPTSYVVGIGNPRVRHAMAERFDSVQFQAATLVHPAATIGLDVEIGRGTVMCAGARATTNITLGRHVHLNPNVTVGHDTALHDFVSMNPGSSVSGDCVVEEEVLIGVGAVVLNGLTVGRQAIVGAAACVVRSVPAGRVVKGVPAQ